VVDFGRYSAVTSLIAIVAALTEAGLGALGTRELSVRPHAGRIALMRELLGIRLALTVVGVGGALAFAWLAGYGSQLVLGTILAGAGLVFYVVQAMLGLPLAVELRVGWITVAELVRQAVYLLVIVGLVLAGAGLVPLLGATIPGGIVGLAITMRLVRGRVPYRPSASRAVWREILRDGLPIAAAGAIYSLYFRVVILLMTLLAAGIQTGYFALSFRIVEVAVLLPGTVVWTMLPVFARAARDDQARLAFAFGLTTEVAVLGGAALTLLGIVGAPLAIGFLTGSATGPAIEVLRIQSVSLIPVFLNVVFGVTFVAMRRHRDMIAVNLLALAVTVGAAFALVPGLEARGGAAAAAGGEWALLIAYVVVLARARPDVRVSLRTVPHAALAFAAALAAGELVHVPVVPNVASVALAALVFAAVLLVTRAVPRELVRALRGQA
jgi:O-antigen/teichoic acid export membrane protein